MSLCFTFPKSARISFIKFSLAHSGYSFNAIAIPVDGLEVLHYILRINLKKLESSNLKERRQDFKRKNHHKLVLHISELAFLFHS